MSELPEKPQTDMSGFFIGVLFFQALGFGIGYIGFNDGMLGFYLISLVMAAFDLIGLQARRCDPRQ